MCHSLYINARRHFCACFYEPPPIRSLPCLHTAHSSDASLLGFQLDGPPRHNWYPQGSFEASLRQPARRHLSPFQRVRETILAAKPPPITFHLERLMMFIKVNASGTDGDNRCLGTAAHGPRATFLDPVQDLIACCHQRNRILSQLL